MSTSELSKLEELKKFHNKWQTADQTAVNLGLSKRQVLRLSKKLKASGPEGLISKKVGAPGNHSLPNELKINIVKIIRERYADFGPTLAHEYLTKDGKHNLSVSSVRNLMIANELWLPKRAKKKRIFQQRERRSCEGEMLQIDGSPHKWLEDRGPMCSLIYTVDDATGKIGSALFCPNETTWSYMHLLKAHIKRHGRPLALYSDKHSVFRVNHKEALGGHGITQFGRAMKELDIKLIFANTPQAKGRIERMNQTLQDRLVKALRLQKISTLEEANAFLPTFIESFNKRFAVVPKNPNNAHRTLLSEHNLDRIFTIKEHRTLSKNLSFQHKNTIYQIVTSRETYALKNARVIIHEKEDGAIQAFHKGKLLLLRTYALQEKQMSEVSSKEINTVVDKLYQQSTIKRRRKHSKRHPYRQYAGRGPLLTCV